MDAILCRSWNVLTIELIFTVRQEVEHLAIERIKSLHSSYLCVWIARHYLVSFNEERRGSQFISLIFFSNWAGICQVEGTNALWISKLKMGDGIPQNYYTCAKEFWDGEGPQVQNIPEVWGQTWLPPHPRPLILGITYHGALCDTEFHFSKHCDQKPEAPRLMEEGNVKAEKVTSSSNV